MLWWCMKGAYHCVPLILTSSPKLITTLSRFLAQWQCFLKFLSHSPEEKKTAVFKLLTECRQRDKHGLQSILDECPLHKTINASTHLFFQGVHGVWLYGRISFSFHYKWSRFFFFWCLNEMLLVLKQNYFAKLKQYKLTNWKKEINFLLIYIPEWLTQYRCSKKSMIMLYLH